VALRARALMLKRGYQINLISIACWHLPEPEEPDLLEGSPPLLVLWLGSAPSACWLEPRVGWLENVALNQASCSAVNGGGGVAIVALS
jgi:hypothetical protein